MKSPTKPLKGDYIQHRVTGDLLRVTKVTKDTVVAVPTVVKFTFNGKPNYHTNSYRFIARNPTK